MKNSPIIITVLLSVITLFSCQNNGDIGDLYGKWKLKEIVTPDTVITDVHSLYLNFQGATFMVQFSQNQQSNEMIFGSYVKSDGNITFSYPPKQTVSEDRIAYVTQKLMYMAVPGTYVIEKEDRKTLEISRNDTTLFFKKY